LRNEAEEKIGAAEPEEPGHPIMTTITLTLITIGAIYAWNSNMLAKAKPDSKTVTPKKKKQKKPKTASV